MSGHGVEAVAILVCLGGDKPGIICHTSGMEVLTMSESDKLQEVQDAVKVSLETSLKLLRTA